MTDKIKLMPQSLPQDVVDRFWGKVEVGDKESCWDWRSALNESGYGRFSINRKDSPIKELLSHRLSFYLANGIDPKDKLVMHKCDRPCCVNPSHLTIGTPKDNCQDRNRKNRHANSVGVNNGANKYSEEDILEMRRMYAEGATTGQIAKQYGTIYNYVYEVVKREVWKHI